MQENVGKILLSDEYDKFMDKIQSGENFVLVRMGDGERSLIMGKTVHAQEGWSAPESVTKLGITLQKCLDHNEPDVYWGIACPCCDREAYYWYSTRLQSKNITFANIFVNVNYKRFKNDFLNIKRKAVVIGNVAGENKKIGNLEVLKYYSVSNQCVDFWSEQGQVFIEGIIKEFGDRDDILYVVSAGPLSEPIIFALYENNPKNCYIDFGSSVDFLIHGKDTRPYNNENSTYAQRNCWMYNPLDVDFSVSVILTTYKKPDALEKQLKVLQNQSLKPKEIILYQDGINGRYKIDFDRELLDEFDRCVISKENYGVWKRFEIAKDKSASKYVCLFDDDTIPGRRWLENCHFHMQSQEAVYGGIGIVLKNPSQYPYSGYYRVGWDGPYGKPVQVDFVGHSWFLPKVYLENMFTDTGKYQAYKLTGEDMCLSFVCQKIGVPTIVPPHPWGNTDLWSSMPKYALNFGKASVAISNNPEQCARMRDVLDKFLADGWRLCKEQMDVDSVEHKIKIGRYVTKLKRYRHKAKEKWGI
ncbi:Glycosyl transferase family 2 [Selenomonas sp. GACV-9]|uniref:glycosyltransferase family 2 protein n=1 Tax=Selenomonas sp. GACV-9 TaxID=3158782 RepID=UPI0008E7064A|nr:Glycosyl transferase family 2 [Selenomonas ruminantium]